MLQHFAQNFIFYGTIVSNVTEPEWTASLVGTLVMKGRLWRGASLFMGAQLGNLEWVRLLGTLRDG